MRVGGDLFKKEGRVVARVPGTGSCLFVDVESTGFVDDGEDAREEAGGRGKDVGNGGEEEESRLAGVVCYE